MSDCEKALIVLENQFGISRSEMIDEGDGYRVWRESFGCLVSGFSIENAMNDAGVDVLSYSGFGRFGLKVFK